MDDCCIFISSSDNTFDVFSLVSLSITKNWAVEDFDLYVGLNNKVAEQPFHTISSPVSGWRTELFHQINGLPDRFHYVILILDDFYFYEKIRTNEIKDLLKKVKERQMDYLRLKPLERSVLGMLFLFLRNCKSDDNSVIELAEDEPYYSSLQVAIWNRTHLLNMLMQSGSIWEFELSVIAGSAHYATVREPVHYSHLVEKGRWLKYAPATLGVHDQDSFAHRGFHQSTLLNSRLYNQIKFSLFGYIFFRFRQAMKQVRS